jgi:hypothetical protein
MTTAQEPKNPFYLLLLIASFAFIATALAYAIVPVLEQQARDQGQDPPPSPFRDSLRVDGWKWLLVQLGIMVVLGLLSMGLDRWRRYRDELREAQNRHDAKTQ